MIVGIGHKARHGKSTVAETLCEEAYRRGRSARIIGFADALKAYCRVMHLMKEKDPAQLQAVGSQFRDIDPDFWVKILLHTISELPLGTLVLVPDLRYENEARKIRELGGLLIDVRRIWPGGQTWYSNDRDPAHASEVGLDGWEDWDRTLVAETGDLVGLCNLARSVYPLTAQEVCL